MAPASHSRRGRGAGLCRGRLRRRATRDSSSSDNAIKVGLVTDTGGVDDKGFNQFSIAGLDQAKEELGVETRVYVSKTADDYQPNLTAASDDGNDLVIAVGFLLAPATVKTAEQYPDISYAGVDHFYGDAGLGMRDERSLPAPEHARHELPLAGVGVRGRRGRGPDDEDRHGLDGGRKKIPPVDNWIAGFQAAAKATKPGIKFLNAYSQDFEDLAKCKEIALDQIAHGLGCRLPGRGQVRPRSDRRRAARRA